MRDISGLEMDIDDIPDGDDIAIMCMKVADDPDKLVPNSRKVPCVGCGDDLWVAPTSGVLLDRADETNRRVDTYCNECFINSVSDDTLMQLVLAPGAFSEASNAAGDERADELLTMVAALRELHPSVVRQVLKAVFAK